MHNRGHQLHNQIICSHAPSLIVSITTADFTLILNLLLTAKMSQQMLLDMPFFHEDVPMLYPFSQK